jgi:hypothetical protein
MFFVTWTPGDTILLKPTQESNCETNLSLDVELN